MQDNNGAKNGEKGDGITSADENAKVLIEAINANRDIPVNYKYVDIEPVELKEGGEPGGNIRVGYLYNEDRVFLHDAPVGSNTEDVKFVDGHLVNNPGRVATTDENFASTRRALATEFVFNGKSVIVIANHLSSKRGDEGEFGPNQPPIKGSEAKRHGQASAINAFIDTVIADTPDANVVVLGDLNDYEYSKTLDVLKGEDKENILTNMIEKLPVNERITYVHNGNSQVLDHILVTNNMVGKTEVDIVNANSMVTAASGRSSDHDPIMIQVEYETKIPAYKDTDTLDRQMFMVMIARMNGRKNHAYSFGIPADFSDVKETDWFASYVWYAFYQGWTAGMGDGTFGVDKPVDARMMAVAKLSANDIEVTKYEKCVETTKKRMVLTGK